LAYESNYTNNSDARIIVLGQVVTGIVSSPSAPGLWLAAPIPNPSRLGALLAFSLATPGPARLAIFDLAGRRVRGWGWDRLAPGVHHVEWDGHSGNGQLVGSGVYFVSFEGAGRRLISKLIRLQ